MIFLKGCVSVKELQSHMRDYFQRQRQRRENHSKPFESKPIGIPRQPKQTIEQQSNPPSHTINYYIYNTAPLSNNQGKTKNKEFDPILFLILLGIVGVFMWFYDAGFRSVTQELIDKGISQLTLDPNAMMFLGLLIAILVIYLISKRK